jgi:hypothetical protein
VSGMMALSLTGLYYFLVEYAIGAYFNIYNQSDLCPCNGLNNLASQSIDFMLPDLSNHFLTIKIYPYYPFLFFKNS